MKVINKRMIYCAVVFLLALALTLFFILSLWSVPTAKVGAKPEKPVETLYTVKPGDTLGSIAKGSNTTWEKLWEANKDTIKNPDLIYPGQKLKLAQTIRPPKSPEEFNKALYVLMFKQMHMKPAAEDDYNAILAAETGLINKALDNKDFYKARKSLDSLKPILIGLETHQLSKAITSLYEKDREMAYLIVALAWKETGFHNRRGKAGELGYYQILPSTLKGIYGKGETYEIAKRRIEEDPKFATEFVVWYLNRLKATYKTWDRVLYRYNGHPEYSGQVMNKLRKTKGIMQ